MLHSWLTPKAAVRDVGEHGHGSFALEAIPAGEVVAAFGGYVVTGGQLPDFDEARVSRSIQIADELYLLASPEVEDGDLVNHSCDPNCGLQGETVLVAKYDLEAGEELTFDYGTCDASPYDEFDCACGARAVPGSGHRRRLARPRLPDAQQRLVLPVHRPADRRPTWAHRGGPAVGRQGAAGSPDQQGIEPRVAVHRSVPMTAYISTVAELGNLFDEETTGESRVVLPSRRLSARRSLGVRIIIALGIVIFTTLLVFWERDGYADFGQDNEVSLIDALYYSTVTLSTTGYGDIAPVTEATRLVNVFVITPLRFIFLIILVGTTVEVLTQAARERSRVNRWRKRMKDQTVIVGFGVKGQAALRSLVAHGLDPRTIVVIASDRYAVAEATRQGVTGVVGDARSEQVLRDAGVPDASRVIVAADQDDTAIMVTLRVRAMAPGATIVAAAREASAGDLLRQSGADRVITHAESAGNLMGLSMLSANVGEMIEDLMDTGRGLEVVERPISRAELGLTPADVQSAGDLVLAVVRGEEVIRFDQGAVRVFQPGDRVVVIRKAHEGVATPPGSGATPASQ